MKSNILRFMIAVGLALLLSACAHRSYFEQTKAAMPQEEIAACEARGGSIVPVCITGSAACVTPYKDAGRPCTDSSECDGNCVPDDAAFFKKFGRSRSDGEEVYGVCEASDYPCGCKDQVLAGKLVGGICWD